ncbi:MAG: Mur ligase family protein [Cypionkella sp.]
MAINLFPEAQRQGASAILCQSEWLLNHPPENTWDSTWIGVEDTRAALAEIAASFYAYPSRQMSLAGVTGTNGKTTTSHLIRALLEKANRPTGLMGTLGCFF